MPELPDVEAFKRKIEKKALRKSVQRTTVHDDRILDDITASGLGRRLKSQSFTAVHRRGKVLFLRQSRDAGSLVLRFGMTGSVQIFSEKDSAPDHTRAELIFASDSRLAVISQRLLGSIGFTNDEQQFIKDEDLGPDALSKALSKNKLIKLFSESRATVKATLMDQSRLAGIGNVYADEILFQAGIRPNHKAGNLSKKESGTVFRKMHHVLTTAADRIAADNDFPDSWLLPQRGKNNPCPCCDGNIKSMKVSGRTTWYCPHCQQ